MKYLYIIIRVLFGFFFVFSGLIKLYPIETFELTFVDLGLASWKFAPFLARIIIAYEVLLGVIITFNLYTKPVLKQTLGLLVFFTFYLAYILVVNGDDSNCGCFGSRFYVTPSQSIVKNIVLIGLNFFLFTKITVIAFNRKKTIAIALAFISIASPFVLNPISLSADNLYDVELPYTIPYLSEIPRPVVNNKEIELDKGEKIIAILSLTCEHCRHAMYKLHIASRQHQIPPVYAVFKGAKSEEAVSKLDDLKDKFFKESNSSFPYTYFNDNRIFKMAKGIFPTILHVKDGQVLHVWHGSTLSYDELAKLETTVSE
jgi:hypothetical protein